MAHSIPPIDMRSREGRAGLRQRQAERAPTRAPKPTKAFGASIRLSAEDLADAIVKTERLEELARDLGLDVRVYAVGNGSSDQSINQRSSDA